MAFDPVDVHVMLIDSCFRVDVIGRVHAYVRIGGGAPGELQAAAVRDGLRLPGGVAPRLIRGGHLAEVVVTSDENVPPFPVRDKGAGLIPAIRPSFRDALRVLGELIAKE